MELELNLSDFYCLNKNCPDYGKKDKGNIRVKEIYEPKNRALLRCNTCTHCFSETRGTIFFGLKTPDYWDPFKVALLNVYGILEQPPYCGIGTKTTSYFGAT